jgi:hypothetical protein
MTALVAPDSFPLAPTTEDELEAIRSWLVRERGSRSLDEPGSVRAYERLSNTLRALFSDGLLPTVEDVERWLRTLEVTLSGELSREAASADRVGMAFFVTNLRAWLRRLAWDRRPFRSVSTLALILLTDLTQATRLALHDLHANYVSPGATTRPVLHAALNELLQTGRVVVRPWCDGPIYEYLPETSLPGAVRLP